MVSSVTKIGYRGRKCQLNGDVTMSVYWLLRERLTHFFRNHRMIDDVYNAKILEFAGNIPRIGSLDDADASARAHSKLCGSTVKVWLKLDGDTVSDFAHEVKACALGQASSSIMANNIIGASTAELRDVREQMTAMLKQNGPPPNGRFSDLQFLEPVRDYKARHASTLLTFDAVVDAINQIEERRAAGAAARATDVCA